jgi:ABC-type cobalamin transport system permease subunit
MVRRPDWTRPLPRPLVIPHVMRLTTLADVRELIERHLPAHFRNKATWHVVAKDLKAAARGADPAEVSIGLRIALSLEGVECRPQ